MSPIAMVLLQASPTPMPRDFDKNLLWNTLHNLWVGFLAQLPYIIVIGLIVFVVFLVIARILKRAVYAAGERTLLGRLASFGINFTAYFGVQSEQAKVLDVSDRVATGIKLALDSAGIDIPFPHAVALFHDATGTRDGDVVSPDYPSKLNQRANPVVRS